MASLWSLFFTFHGFFVVVFLGRVFVGYALHMARPCLGHVWRMFATLLAHIGTLRRVWYMFSIRLEHVLHMFFHLFYICVFDLLHILGLWSRIWRLHAIFVTRHGPQGEYVFCLGSKADVYKK